MLGVCGGVGYIFGLIHSNDIIRQHQAFWDGQVAVINKEGIISWHPDGFTRQDISRLIQKAYYLDSFYVHSSKIEERY